MGLTSDEKRGSTLDGNQHYNFQPESQAELQRAQITIKRLIQDKKSGSGPGQEGGKISLGVAQQSIPTRELSPLNMPWNSWLRTRRSGGFLELWSGTVGELLRQAGVRN